jgi:DNA-binding beta-propeller fold protein YncE
VSLISLSTGQTLVKLPSGPHPQEVVFSLDGRRAIVSNMGTGAAKAGKTLTVVNVETKAIEKSIDLGAHGMPHGLAILDDARVLFTSHFTDSVVVANFLTGAVEKAISSEGKGTHLAVLSPDRKIAYTANVGTGDVSIIDLSQGKVTARLESGPRAEGIAISPDGSLLSVGNMGGDSVSLFDLKTKTKIRTYEGVPVPIRTFFSADGSRLFVSAAGAGQLWSYDLRSQGAPQKLTFAEGSWFTLKGDQGPIPMNFERHSDGRHIFVAIINADAIAVVDAKDMKVVAAVKTGVLPDGIAWSHGPQGKGSKSGLGVS